MRYFAPWAINFHLQILVAASRKQYSVRRATKVDPMVALRYE
jgi:hypothetical protein